MAFDWGEETAIGDALWWQDLQKYIYKLTAEERLALVGKKKKVSLSTAVLGADAASMLCIGADIDADCTLTFQTEGTLPTITKFGSDALWDGSTAQSLCKNFGDYCSARDSLKSITKLTSSACNNSGANTADVSTTAKCWLLSENEMGFEYGRGCSPSDNEWTSGGKTQAYQYYTDNNRRIKYIMNADGSLATTAKSYWERSRYYRSDISTAVCIVGSNGDVNMNYCSNSYGLAPAFTIEGIYSEEPSPPSPEEPSTPSPPEEEPPFSFPERDNFKSYLQDIADAIKYKTGKTEDKIKAINFPNEILKIESSSVLKPTIVTADSEKILTITPDDADGFNQVTINPPTSYNATATAANIENGKTAYVETGKVTGTLENRKGGMVGFSTIYPSQSKTSLLLQGKFGGTCIIDSTTDINAYVSLSYLGDAKASQVQSGCTFTSSAGVKVTGTGNFTWNTYYVNNDGIYSAISSISTDGTCQINIPNEVYVANNYYIMASFGNSSQLYSFSICYLSGGIINSGHYTCLKGSSLAQGEMESPLSFYNNRLYIDNNISLFNLSSAKSFGYMYIFYR